MLRADRLFYKLLMPGLIVFLSFLAGCASAPKPEAVSEPVKEAEVVEEKVEEEVSVAEYLVTKETVTYQDGTVDSYSIREFEENRVILEQQFSSDESEILKREVSWKEGNMVREDIYIDGELTNYVVYVYENGLNIREESYDAKDELQSSDVFEYDADGKITKWTAKDGNGAPLLISLYDYEGEQLDKIRYETPYGDDEGYTDYIYDGEKISEVVSYTPSGKVEKSTRSSWADDRLVKEEFFAGKRLYRTAEYGYDESGYVVSVSYMDSSNSVYEIVRYEYELWLEK